MTRQVILEFKVEPESIDATRAAKQKYPARSTGRGDPNARGALLASEPRSWCFDGFGVRSEPRRDAPRAFRPA